MDVKTLLRSYRPALIAAQRTVERLDDAREATIKSPRLDGMPRTGGGHGLDDQIARIDALERRLFREREKAIDVSEKIEAMIEALTDWDEKNVMRFRYLEGMAWEAVAVNAYMSRRKAIAVHGRALEKLRRDEKWQD